MLITAQPEWDSGRWSQSKKSWGYRNVSKSKGRGEQWCDAEVSEVPFQVHAVQKVRCKPSHPSKLQENHTLLGLLQRSPREAAHFKTTMEITSIAHGKGRAKPAVSPLRARMEHAVFHNQKMKPVSGSFKFESCLNLLRDLQHWKEKTTGLTKCRQEGQRYVFGHCRWPQTCHLLGVKWLSCHRPRIIIWAWSQCLTHAEHKCRFLQTPSPTRFRQHIPALGSQNCSLKRNDGAVGVCSFRPPNEEKQEC